MLDVGCGMGHWGQMLARFLSAEAKLIGIDPETTWIENAKSRITNLSVLCQTDYLVGFAEKIPFPDNYFDMVTCQTVLMHVKDVHQAINEMKRVLKPNGLFAVAEPDNFGFSFSTLNFNDSIEEIINQLQFNLTCLRGRQKLNQDNFSLGSILPYYLYQSEIRDIQVYVNDLASSFVPPYNTVREKILIEKLKSQKDENWERFREEALANFIEGGGKHPEFEKNVGKRKINKKGNARCYFR